MSEWIDCRKTMPVYELTEGMPTEYLCKCNDIITEWHQVLWFIDDDWVDLQGEEFEAIVTHWQPIEP